MRQRTDIKIAPSILAADFARLGEEVAAAERAGADYIHVDIMDGHFVPSITLGPLMVAAIRPWTSLPLDIHLMIDEPDRYLRDFVVAGADIITVHWEAVSHLHRTIQTIRELGAKAGVALNPATPTAVLSEILMTLDLVVLMSVNPGFGGQSYISGIEDKIRRVRQMLDQGESHAELEVDGGINVDTARRVVEAGAKVLVAGSAIFHADESPSDALERLRQSF